jgi:cytochrome c553
MKIHIVLLAMLAGVPVAQAADLEAGKARVAAVCAACHGANGVSVAGYIPNLAGQKAEYIGDQLHAFKGGERKSDLMQPIAGQLDDGDIDNVAAFFASLAGASAGTEKSAFLPNVAATHVRFPADYRASFTRYLTMDFPDDKLVRHYFANSVAIRAAKAGETLPDGSMILVEVYKAALDDKGSPVRGDDGHFAPGELAGYAAMERQAGWGEALPEMLRNENWNYAPFSADRVIRSGFNQAICFACHKPRNGESHMFTMDQLRAFARSM